MESLRSLFAGKQPRVGLGSVVCKLEFDPLTIRIKRRKTFLTKERYVFHFAFVHISLFSGSRFLNRSISVVSVKVEFQMLRTSKLKGAATNRCLKLNKHAVVQARVPFQHIEILYFTSQFHPFDCEDPVAASRLLVRELLEVGCIEVVHLSRRSYRPRLQANKFNHPTLRDVYAVVPLDGLVVVSTNDSVHGIVQEKLVVLKHIVVLIVQ